VPAAPVTLLVPVEDRTGVLAEVVIPPTEAGVSIAGVGIVDAPEGGRGWVRLVINGEEPARRAFEALEQRGFSPVIAPPPGASS
ncbi:MAG TPA: hypothetical protein VHA57_13375, partial [Actinomycetota bacterium]|nr:hypothetical protein [Actinomycetota bacterium]